MILGRVTRNLSIPLVILATGALGLACPAKDLDVVITKRGSAFLALACNQGQTCLEKTHAVCAKTSACVWDADLARCTGNCRLPGNPAATLDGLHDMEILLFSSNPAKLRTKSACVAINACSTDDYVGCLEASLNDAITRSLAESPELTFDGFNSTADGIAAIAVFERPDGSDGSEPPSCAPDRLIACAGLDVPLNESKLDIECASCQGGQRTAVGESTRPCPTDILSPKSCFVRTCFGAIGGAAAD